MLLESAPRPPGPVLYLTTSFPYGKDEAYILPELEVVRRSDTDFRVIPLDTRPPRIHDVPPEIMSRTVARGPLSVIVLVSALLEFGRAPRRSVAALVAVVRGSRRKHLALNLLAAVRGLWIAHLVRRVRAHHIHCHWANFTATAALVASRVSGCPWSLTLHRYDIVENNLLELKLREASFSRFISRSGVSLAAARVPPQALSRAVVTHMGVRVPPLSASRRPVVDPAVFLCPASLVEVKGHAYLLRAVKVLKDRSVPVALWFAGSGPLIAELTALRNHLGVQGCVHFLGQLPNEEILNMYSRREVYGVVLPSVDLGNGLHEGIPVCLLEAMAYGVPVISTETGGITEALGGGAGLLVKDKDPAALADAMERLCQDGALWDALSTSGRQRVESTFSVDANVGQLLNYMGRGGKPPAGNSFSGPLDHGP